MSFRVFLTEEAERNARSIRDWLWKRSPEDALRWLDALENAKEQLAHNPFSCSLAPKTKT